MSEDLVEFNRNEGTSPETIRDVERRLGVTLPGDYVEFLCRSNGGEGPMGAESYLILWPVDELPAKNEGYKADADFAPHLIFVGTDGGNEVFAVRESDGHYVAAPLIGMSSDAIEERGATFEKFLASFR